MTLCIEGPPFDPEAGPEIFICFEGLCRDLHVFIIIYKEGFHKLTWIF